MATVNTSLRIAGALMLLASAYQTFNLGNMTGFVPLTNQFIYVALALLLPFAFLLWPRWGKVDLVLAGLAFAVGSYFVAISERIVMEGLEYGAPWIAQNISILFWLLTLEAGRRIGGTAMMVVVAPLSLYPLVADKLPAVLNGFSMPLRDTAVFYAMSSEGILGVPMRAFINLVLGFLVFGVALQKTGGGKFFLDLAFAALGHVRGGPAKVAILSSGLMGSMSGSVITNVLTTGTLTIPTMKRTGIRAATAGGIEACASTGGVLAPPVMGATAFVMATFLNVPYQEIALAAILPTLLYFLGLFFQIDALAARQGLAGLPEAELPKLRKVMREGWWFLAVFVLLIWMLLVLNREAWAPWFATALLFVINQALPQHRWGWRDFGEFLEDIGRLFAEMAGLLAAVGLIVGALVVTGKIGNIAGDLLGFAGGNLYLLLLMGAATAFVLGIGMTVTAAYIFLAVGLAPALIQAGLEPLPVHLFILYWSMLSYITPPVAIGGICGSNHRAGQSHENRNRSNAPWWCYLSVAVLFRSGTCAAYARAVEWYRADLWLGTFRGVFDLLRCAGLVDRVWALSGWAYRRTVARTYSILRPRLCPAWRSANGAFTPLYLFSFAASCLAPVLGWHLLKKETPA